MTPLASASIILSLTFLLWTSLRYLKHEDWTLPTSQSSRQHADLVSDLMSENSRLQALQALQSAATTNETETDHDSTSDRNEEGFAYVFYATADPYACSVLVNIHRLHDLLHVTYPIHVLVSSAISETYIDAFRSAGVTVHVERAPPLKGTGASYYQDCLLKLVAFKLHEWDPTLKRVLAFDSDQLVMKNLDHLFVGLPDVDLAAPRAYWLAKDFLASTFLMINLSDRLWRTVETALATVQYNKFDMDLINEVLGETVMMLSGEYVTLNSHWEDWGLPSWYHASEGLNLTTVNLYNQLLKSGMLPGRALAGRHETESSRNEGGDPRADPAQSQPESSIDPAQSLHPHTMVAAKPEVPSARPLTPMRRPFGPRPVISHQPPLVTADSHPSDSKPRFPAGHPFSQELYRLQDAAAVIHFTAAGKPWMHSPEHVRDMKPDAHPALAEQFELWRATAADVCPGGIPGEKD
ncbi:hypothetical protein Tdes44962_MAKER09748 [Teratosphaeria destructans]|uniref:Nucleotide-diphospho-sugar transferase n=1 Tax=Teratosphaeria destructans TaxID=418781 RepID=A0A9W7SS71_9PEZI|nr:hypothetical protein Tdes44962_MAKER09748 [Teratosphaeria destructans]